MSPLRHLVVLTRKYPPHMPPKPPVEPLARPIEAGLTIPCDIAVEKQQSDHQKGDHLNRDGRSTKRG